MSRLPHPWLVLLISLFTFSAAAQAAGTAEAQLAEARRLADSLQYREGTITLKNGLATVNVASDFRFLEAKDAQTVLTRIWGNPPDADVLGMLLPAGMSPLDEKTWAVIVSYEESGYVKDDEAAKMDYNKLLKEMQEGVREANPERVKQGYQSIELVNWATTPHYDKASHKIYWAKHLRFGGASDNTLNYCVRALGRRGVLELNAVASMAQLPDIEQATPAILRMVNFQEGHRYADFNSSTDKVASYGIAALITGGVLAKTGLLKGLIAGIIAFKKFIIIGAIGLFAMLKKLFFGKSGDSIERG